MGDSGQDPAADIDRSALLCAVAHEHLDLDVLRVGHEQGSLSEADGVEIAMARWASALPLHAAEDQLSRRIAFLERAH
ncbi:hypothetical protein [Salinibacterium sp. ZJ70]|uniref:hypothetical protein n=1 Tax=Salinibacterium sp. ZJ70 TaxID=2708084 RepID=UPI001423FA52|nr:hypothetical protein [Salinibacterium sp. ZJ70]